MNQQDPFSTFRMMIDEYSSQILELTAQKPMNACELSETLRIPIAACYRRIRMLREAGILAEDGKTVSVGGKSVATYRSAIGSAQVVLQDGRLKVVIEANGERSTDEMDLDSGPTMLHWPMSKVRTDGQH